MKFIQIKSGSFLNLEKVKLITIDKSNFYGEYVWEVNLCIDENNEFVFSSHESKEKAEESLRNIFTTFK